MSPTQRVELRLLGQTLTVRTEAAPDHVRALAAFVEERVGDVQRPGVRDPLAALSLAALDIADELFRVRDDRARGTDDVRARLDALVALLEQVTPPGPS